MHRFRKYFHNCLLLLLLLLLLMRLITLSMSTCERRIVGAGSHAIRQKTTVDINEYEAMIEIVQKSQLFAHCTVARFTLKVKRS